MRSKQNGALDFTVRPGYLLCSYTKKVRELMFKKYFKTLLVSKSWYLKLQGSHKLYARHLSFSVISRETEITRTNYDISFD